MDKGDDESLEQALVQEALKALEEFAGPASRLDVRFGNGAELMLEWGGGRATFEALLQRKLGKEVAAQIAASRGERSERAVLVIAGRVTEAAGALLRKEGISYLDAAGNCYIRASGLLLFVTGQKSKTIFGRRRRAFQKAGLKIIFALLESPELIEAPYRAIAEMAGVSRGAVGYVVRDLEELGYVEQGGSSRRVLEQAPALAKRWASRYAEVLRPELVRGRFRFVGEGSRRWRRADLRPGTDWWSGEPAADLMTQHLRPEQLTLYTRDGASREVMERLGAIPDPDGPLEILSAFWTRELETQVLEEGPNGTGAEQDGWPKQVASPLLVYADLLASGASRNLQLARMIREQHLSEAAFKAQR